MLKEEKKNYNCINCAREGRENVKLQYVCTTHKEVAELGAIEKARDLPEESRKFFKFETN